MAPHNTATECPPGKVAIYEPAPHRAAFAVFLLQFFLANPCCVLGTWLYTYVYADTWTAFELTLYTVVPGWCLWCSSSGWT